MYASPTILLFWGWGTVHLLVYLPGQLLVVHRKAGNVCLRTLDELLSLRERQVEQLFLNRVVNGRDKEKGRSSCARGRESQVEVGICRGSTPGLTPEEYQVFCRLGTECLEGLCIHPCVQSTSKGPEA